MLKQTLSAWINADYVLMDTWFTTEPFIQRIKALGLDVSVWLNSSVNVMNTMADTLI